MIRCSSRMCQSGLSRTRPLKGKLVQTRKINSLFQMIASMLLMWLSISVYVFILKKQWWLLIQVLRRINPFWLHKKGVKLCIRVTPWFRASPENRPQKSNYFKVNTTKKKMLQLPISGYPTIYSSSSRYSSRTFYFGHFFARTFISTLECMYLVFWELY